MSSIKTGNATHDGKAVVAETTRQAAVVPTASKATVVTAEAAFARTVVASAATNSCGLVPFMTYLRENGQSLYP